MSRILAIDYGKKRTGLAVTDPMRIMANPLTTVESSQLLTWLADYLQKEDVGVIVIGHPKQMSGEESESMTYIRPFMAAFQQRFPDRELILFDERFTSVLAHRAMIDGGMKKKQRQDKAVVDKIAACIILESYMQSIGLY